MFPKRSDNENENDDSSCGRQNNDPQDIQVHKYVALHAKWDFENEIKNLKMKREALKSKIEGKSQSRRCDESSQPAWSRGKADHELWGGSMGSNPSLPPSQRFLDV